jgi:hypothetical protein
MILTREITITITDSNYSYYENLGYEDLMVGDNITIPIELLSKGSHTTVKCKCDSCGLEKDIIYKNFLKYKNQKWGEYFCRKCSEFKRKKTLKENIGVEYPIQNKEIRKKIEQTILNKKKK